MSRLSSSVDTPIQIQIVKIRGNVEKILFEDLLSTLGEHTWCRELWVSCHLYANDKLLVSPQRTRFANADSDKHFCWNEWLQFPIKFKDLPRNAQLLFLTWNIKLPKVVIAVGASVFPLFDVEGNLFQGKYRLILKPLINSNEPLRSVLISETETFSVDTYFDPLKHLMRYFTFTELSKFVKVPSFPSELKSKRKLLKKVSNGADKNINDVILTIFFPEFGYNVVFHDKIYYELLHVQNTSRPQRTAETSRRLLRVSNREKNDADRTAVNETVFIVNDPEEKYSNPAEEKHIKMVTAKECDFLLFDKDLKPNNDENKKLLQIIQYPPTMSLTQEERLLVWKFRGYLLNFKKALPKFLKCVDWKQPKQSKHAEYLLQKWQPIGIDDALELLSFRFESQFNVRRYAVNCLRQTSDEELKYYLLQLVHALRYDRDDQESLLFNFLLKKATENFEIANFLYWFLKVESMQQSVVDYNLKLVKFTYILANTEKGKVFLEHLEKQTNFFNNISYLCVYINQLSVDEEERTKEATTLIRRLQPSFQPFPLPLKPSLTVNGLLANVQIFKSAKKPIKLTFTTSTNDNFSILYKVGDDLRQDQLVLQLISLMDRLLKKENLDLKLLPYRVLATSLKEGMIEFVPNACSLSSIRNNYNRDIASFLRKYNSDTNGPFGIKESVFDTYVKSCAGYCVITYILGVGDRHLDNILITTSGNFFHIDFGYIFGRDPKGLVSPMRIPREVVEAMGGQNSKYYDLFLSLCCEAYNILRKSSNLLLNLILLMIHSNIPQLQGENDLLKVENRLNMHLNDEEAALRMRNLVSESINSFASEFAERLHNLPKLLS